MLLGRGSAGLGSVGAEGGASSPFPHPRSRRLQPRGSAARLTPRRPQPPMAALTPMGVVAVAVGNVVRGASSASLADHNSRQASGPRRRPRRSPRGGGAAAGAGRRQRLPRRFERDAAGVRWCPACSVGGSTLWVRERGEVSERRRVRRRRWVSQLRLGWRAACRRGLCSFPSGPLRRFSWASPLRLSCCFAGLCFR